MDKLEQVDEQIISMLYGAEEERDGKRDTMHPQSAPLQTIVKIDGEMISFKEELLLNGRIRIPLPKTFRLMPPEAAAMKYPSAHRPDVIYSNDRASITIAFSVTEQPITDEEMEEFTAAMVQILRRTQPIQEWYEDGVRILRDKSIGYCEFQIPTLDTGLYQLMFFAELEGKALLCTFNCTEGERKYWRPLARGLMDSMNFVMGGQDNEPETSGLS